MVIKRVCTTPMCTGMTVNHEGKAILSFEAGTDKLRVVDELKGFAIAGADGHFQWAEAVVVNGNQVAVWHKGILISDGTLWLMIIRFMRI